MLLRSGDEYKALPLRRSAARGAFVNVRRLRRGRGRVSKGWLFRAYASFLSHNKTKQSNIILRATTQRPVRFPSFARRFRCVARISQRRRCVSQNPDARCIYIPTVLNATFSKQQRQYQIPYTNALCSVRLAIDLQYWQVNARYPRGCAIDVHKRSLRW